MDDLLHKYLRRSAILGKVNTASLQILRDFHLQSAENMQILRSFNGGHLLEGE
jgi:hypothetical protein